MNEKLDRENSYIQHLNRKQMEKESRKKFLYLLGSSKHLPCWWLVTSLLLDLIGGIKGPCYNNHTETIIVQ